MSDDNLGFGKRASKRTERVGDYDSKMAATKEKRENLARSKKVTAQEAEIAANEQHSDHEDEDEEDESGGDEGDDYDNEDDKDDEEFAEDAKELVPKPKTKPRAKGKAKEIPAKKVDPERKGLVDMISVLFKTPVEELELFDTDGLRTLWNMKVEEKTGKGAIKSGAKPKPKPKPKPAATPKPKRIKATVPMKSSITMVGSPALALKAREEYTAQVMALPLAERRKRDASIDLGNPDAKRIHLDEKGTLSKPAVPSGAKQLAAKLQSSTSRASSAAQSITASSITASSRAADSSRAASRAPSHAPSRAPSVIPTAPVATSRSSSLALPTAPAPTRPATKLSLPAIKDLDSDPEAHEQMWGYGTLEEYCDERSLDEDEEPVLVPTAKSPMKKKKKSKKKCHEPCT